MRRATYKHKGKEFTANEYGRVSCDYAGFGKVEEIEDNGWCGYITGVVVPVIVDAKNRKAAVIALADRYLDEMPEHPCNWRDGHASNGLPVFEPAVAKVQWFEQWDWRDGYACEHCLRSRVMKVVEYVGEDVDTANMIGPGVDLRCVKGWILSHMTIYPDDEPDILRAWEEIPTYHRDKDSREFYTLFFDHVAEVLSARPDAKPWLEGADKAEVSERGYGGFGLGSYSNHLVKFPNGYALMEGARRRGSGGDCVVWCMDRKSKGTDFQSAAARFLRDHGGILAMSQTPPVLMRDDDRNLLVVGPAGEVKITYEVWDEDLPRILDEVGGAYEKNGVSRLNGFRSVLELFGLINGDS